MRLAEDKWDLSHLQTHLQYAVDLEFWTIPFYMSAMYSIIDRTSDAYQLIRSVVNQEMLHLQSAANIANAYGLSPTFDAPVYEGQNIPHIDFSGDSSSVIDQFKPYSAEIGPLDEERINAMCLIEIPEDLTNNPPNLNDNVKEYGSIGAFYQAVAYGAAQLTKDLRGGINQVDFFSAFYRNAPALTITESKDMGFNQVSMLIELITDQGEGEGVKEKKVDLAFQNTADDPAPEEDHYEKFLAIKNSKDGLPATFPLKSPSDYTIDDKKLQKILVMEFTNLRSALQQLFSGENPQNFFPIMASVGGAIRNCWANGVTPKFS